MSRAGRSRWWQASWWEHLPLCPALPSAAPHPCLPAPSRKPRVWSPGVRLSSGWWRTASCLCHGLDWPWTVCPGLCAEHRSSRPQTCCHRWTCLLCHYRWWCHHPKGTKRNLLVVLHDFPTRDTITIWSFDGIWKIILYWICSIITF